MTSTIFKRAKPKLKAPQTLSKDMQKWWREMAESYEFDRQHLDLLAMAAAEKQKDAECGEIIAKEGKMIEGMHGRRAHPLLAVQRDARLTFARLIKQLRLEED